MILAKMYYETHIAKLLAIIRAFKKWRLYLEDYQYEILVLINYKNLYWFMDIKSLSSRQVHWA